VATLSAVSIQGGHLLGVVKMIGRPGAIGRFVVMEYLFRIVYGRWERESLRSVASLLSTRRAGLVLSLVDTPLFVADSAPDRVQSRIESTIGQDAFQR
jgi:hypothetical protein